VDPSDAASGTGGLHLGAAWEVALRDLFFLRGMVETRNGKLGWGVEFARGQKKPFMCHRYLRILACATAANWQSRPSSLSISGCGTPLQGPPKHGAVLIHPQFRLQAIAVKPPEVNSGNSLTRARITPAANFRCKRRPAAEIHLRAIDLRRRALGRRCLDREGVVVRRPARPAQTMAALRVERSSRGLCRDCFGSEMEEWKRGLSRPGRLPYWKL